MKRLVLFNMLTMLMGIGAVSGFAANPDDGVWVEQLDGTRQGFLFAEKPVITYTTDNLVMTTTVAMAEFPFAVIKRVYFDDDISTAIRNVVQPDGTAPLIRVTSDGVQLSGFAAKTAVSIYDTSGQLLTHEHAAADGTLMVNFSAHPKGIYIIKTNQTTLKIQKQ